MSDSTGGGDPPDTGSRRRRLEGVIPELLKRAIEIGVDKAQNSPESVRHFVSDMKLPKEMVNVILSQVDETKNGLFRVVAKEMRDFLEHTNIAGEMQKMLTTVQFEINTTVRFTPNDGPAPGSETSDGSEPPPGEAKLPKPEVKTQMHVSNVPKREDRRDRRRARE